MIPLILPSSFARLFAALALTLGVFVSHTIIAAPFLYESFSNGTSGTNIGTATTSDGNGSWTKNRNNSDPATGSYENTAQPFVDGDNPFRIVQRVNTLGLQQAQFEDSTLNFTPLSAGETLYFSFNLKMLADSTEHSHKITFYNESASTPFMELEVLGAATDYDLRLEAQGNTQTLTGAITAGTAYFVYGKLETSGDLKDWTFSASITDDISTIPQTESWQLSQSNSYTSARSSHANRLEFNTASNSGGLASMLIDEIRLANDYNDVVGPEDRTGQIVILKMDDLRENFTTTGVKQTWIDVMSKIRAANAKTTIGIVAMYINGDGTGTNVLGASNDLGNGGQEWIDWVKAEHAAGDAEFWQHGWDHLPALDEDASGNTQEFEASLSRQQNHFDWAQDAASDELDFDFRTFGPPGNKLNADTITIMDAAPEISARFYGDDITLISNAFNIRRFGGTIETGSGGNFTPSFSVYEAAQASDGHRPYMAFQMHPEYWLSPTTDLATFQLILDDLVARNVTFMTALELAEHVEDKRKAVGPLINFNTWGDFDFLFEQLGQVHKYTETAATGLSSSRALVVGTGGTQSNLVLQRSIPGSTPSMEISLYFQHITPTSSGGQPLFIGLGPDRLYEPTLSNSTAEKDHFHIALDMNGAASNSEPRLRIASSVDGTFTSSTSAYVGTPLTAGNWYRLRASITYDVNGYDITAYLEDSDSDGVIGSQLLTHSTSNISIPDLAAADTYAFLGGQGSAYQRGIGTLDNFSFSPLAPITETTLGIDEEAESVILSWTPPAGADSIKVLRSTSPYSGFTEIASLSGTATGYTDNGLTSGTTYYYQVISYNADGATQADGESSGLALTHLQDFRMDYFGTIENTGNAADDYDAEPDGLTNLHEFAFGGVPNVNDAKAIQPSISIGNDGSDDYLEVTFRRREGTFSGTTETGYSIDGITYAVQTRADLGSGSWATNPANLEQIGSATNVATGIEEVTVRIKPAIDSSSNPSHFCTVDVSTD